MFLLSNDTFLCYKSTVLRYNNYIQGLNKLDFGPLSYCFVKKEGANGSIIVFAKQEQCKCPYVCY